MGRVVPFPEPPTGERDDVPVVEVCRCGCVRWLAVVELVRGTGDVLDVEPLVCCADCGTAYTIRTG